MHLEKSMMPNIRVNRTVATRANSTISLPSWLEPSFHLPIVLNTAHSSSRIFVPCSLPTCDACIPAYPGILIARDQLRFPVQCDGGGNAGIGETGRIGRRGRDDHIIDRAAACVASRRSHAV